VAVTVGRLAALAGLGCLALAVAYAPPPPGERRFGTPTMASPETSREERLSDAYGRAQHALLAVRLRDSLRRTLRDAAPGADVHVAVIGPLPESSRRELARGVHHVWEELTPLPGARIAVILNTRRERAQTIYLLPRVLDGRTCAASVPVGWSIEWLWQPTADARGINLHPWLREALAPCLYYATFGPPGPAIEAWLTARAFHPAGRVDWTEGAGSPSGTTHSLDYNVINSNVSFDALACGDGRLARCRPALFTPFENVARADGIVVRRYWTTFPGERYLLAALVEEMGPDRFTRFWRSPAPVDSAFFTEFGLPFEVWTARWMRRFVRDVPPLGPAPRPVAVVYGLVLAAFALAAAAGYTTRRRVT
jgi:hypothetical protein